MGRVVVEAGGATVKDDYDLLLGDAAIEDWKNNGRPEEWLEHRKTVMLARLHDQKASLETLLASAPPTTVARFDKPI